MSVLFLTHETCLAHLTGERHPERPARLDAVADGIARMDLADALTMVEAVPASDEAIAAVHQQAVIDLVDSAVAAGGGRIDADTVTSAESGTAARLAAGAGLQAVGLLSASDADAVAAFCAVRPPGHHATPDVSMGFCLFNNVAVTASHLAAQGERVLIVDYDVHHGNGTQDIFFTDDRVMFISFHQFPHYPGSGGLMEIGADGGRGYTMNFPFPPGTTGDQYRRAWDDVALPQIEAFRPTWVLLSAGFDAHRQDPLSDMGLTAGDFAAMTNRVLNVAPVGRRIAFLEGGYDLDGLAKASGAALAAMAGLTPEVEASSNGGAGGAVVDEAAALWARGDIGHQS